jgi:5-methyltetrahydropteroyltriglutamate--homocysteine methyltransferase
MKGAELRTTVVGSYPVPGWLPRPVTAEALADATAAVVRAQERAGIDVVADGELYRFDPNHPETNGMVDFFARQLDGVSATATAEEAEAFARERGMGYRARPGGVVRGALGPGTLDLAADCARVRALVSPGRRLKFTLTGPHMLSRVWLDRHYGDRRRLALGIADVLAAQVARLDCDVVQVDEANIPGHPEDAAWAADAVSRILGAVRPGCERAVHVCFGNYGGQRVQRGDWEALLPYLNALPADHLVLEAARPQGDALAAFSRIRAEIGLGIGVIDVKDLTVETPEVVAERIRRAVAAVGPQRLRYVHPDCGLWMLPRSVADGKLAALGRGRDLYLERWG